jgi:hypothetical protein
VSVSKLILGQSKGFVRVIVRARVVGISGHYEHEQKEAMAERPTDMSIEQLKQRYQAYAQSLSQGTPAVRCGIIMLEGAHACCRAGEDPTIDACTVREEVQSK